MDIPLANKVVLSLRKRKRVQSRHGNRQSSSAPRGFHHAKRDDYGFRCLATLVLLGVAANCSLSPAGAAEDFAATAVPLLKQFCFECHGNEEAEANIHLERLSAERSFATSFKDWQRVAAMLEQGKMPPKDAGAA